MLLKILFSSFTLLANALLFGTVARLVVFLSSQTVPVNDNNVSTLALFTMDVCLVVIFMAQHSALASPTYRMAMKKCGLAPVTRSLYILTTALILQFVMSFWQPISEVTFWLIDVEDRPLLWMFFHVLHWVLWLVLLLEVLALEPLYLIGVIQVYHYVLDCAPPKFSRSLSRLLYNMPHPGSVIFVAILWVHPVMTFDRMILATVLTAYLCGGMSVSEGDYRYVKTESQYSQAGFLQIVKFQISWHKLAVKSGTTLFTTHQYNVQAQTSGLEWAGL